MQAEPLAPRGQPRSLTSPPALAAVQGIDFLVLAALAVVVGMTSSTNAVAHQKPTAATFGLAFAVVGALFFAASALTAFVFAWGLYMRKGWAIWPMAVLEGLWLLLTALWLLRGVEVDTLLQIALAGATLLSLVAGRAARADGPARDRRPSPASWRSCCQAVPSSPCAWP